LTQADAAEIVLQDAKRPLHREDISGEILKRNLPVWGRGKPGKTPWESVGRALTQEIAHRGAAARFEYVGGKGSGVFTLRSAATGEADSAPSIGLVRGRDYKQGETDATGWADADILKRISALGAEPALFVRNALLQALKEAEVRKLEEEHRRGYERIPVQPDEFVEMDPEAWDEL
jgi:hypothetical protein